MKRVVSLGMVVLLCGVGLQGGVTLPVQQESSSPILYEPKSPLARNHKLLQLVTEADRVLQLSSAAWGSMLIHDEWSELTGWLAMVRGRKPKDFKQRCVALRNFIQQSPEVDPVVSAVVLKALACIMRTYTGMSVGAKVGIGVGVTATALAAATAVAALAMFAKLRGSMPNSRGAALRGGASAGVAPESGAAGLGHIPGTGPDTSRDEALAIAAEGLLLRGQGGAGAELDSDLIRIAERESREQHELRQREEQELLYRTRKFEEELLWPGYEAQEGPHIEFYNNIKKLSGQIAGHQKLTTVRLAQYRSATIKAVEEYNTVLARELSLSLLAFTYQKQIALEKLRIIQNGLEKVFTGYVDRNPSAGSGAAEGTVS